MEAPRIALGLLGPLPAHIAGEPVTTFDCVEVRALGEVHLKTGSSEVCACLAESLTLRLRLGDVSGWRCR